MTNQQARARPEPTRTAGRQTFYGPMCIPIRTCPTPVSQPQGRSASRRLASAWRGGYGGGKRPHTMMRACPDCMREGHDRDATHCKFCGGKL